jgi:hypothetical protein
VPEGSAEATEPETRGAWYLRQIRGSANIEGPDWFHVLSGNLSHQIEHHPFPDLPSCRYAQIAATVEPLSEVWHPIHDRFFRAASRKRRAATSSPCPALCSRTVPRRIHAAVRCSWEATRVVSVARSVAPDAVTPASNGAEMPEGQFYTHTVCVLETDLTSPPGGGVTYTTSGPDPMHTIALTAPPLTTISGGQSVTVSTSTNGGHNHQFVLIRM